MYQISFMHLSAVTRMSQQESYIEFLAETLQLNSLILQKRHTIRNKPTYISDSHSDSVKKIQLALKCHVTRSARTYQLPEQED